MLVGTVQYSFYDLNTIYCDPGDSQATLYKKGRPRATTSQDKTINLSTCETSISAHIRQGSLA